MDPYATLGIDSGASPEAIRKAYKSKSQIHHPDKNPDDPYATTRFQLIKEAYDILKNPDRRTRFDKGENPRSFDTAGAAMTVLVTVLFDQLRTNGDRNITQNMRKAMGSRVAEISQASKKGTKVASDIERATDKFSYSGKGRNVLADAIDDQHNKAIEEVARLKQELETWRHAGKLLDD